MDTFAKVLSRIYERNNDRLNAENFNVEMFAYTRSVYFRYGRTSIG